MADENDGICITQRLTHHMIAQMIGSSRETVSRTMRDLVGQEIIEVTRKIIKIQNRRDSQPVGDGGAGSDSVVEVSRRVIVIQNRQALETSAGMS
jgi:DNA-binding transcriptional regulator YhcF (GntR family)